MKRTSFYPAITCLLALGSSCKGTEGSVFLDRNNQTADSGSNGADSSVFEDDVGGGSDARVDTGTVDTGFFGNDGSVFDDDGSTRDDGGFFDNDGSTTDDGSVDNDGSVNDGGLPAVDCSQNPPVFPSFDRSCLAASDCEIGTVQVDCCGTLTVTGINQAEEQRFADAAALCNAQFPACGCPTQPTRADDGTMQGLASGPVIVQCVANTCQTTFVPNPTPCGGNLTCDPFTDICVATTPIGPAIQYTCESIPAGCDENRSCSCAGASLCSPPFDTCLDSGPNQFSCECLVCQ